MDDPFMSHAEIGETVPAQKIQGRVTRLLKAEGRNFYTTEVEKLPLTFDGIPGDFHAGPTRKSGGREPWYKRGTEMRNERQLSLLSPAELRTIARRLEIDEVLPEWMGGNMLVEGVEEFTMLPPRTLLFFEGGVTIKIDGDNGPCRLTGRSIASHFDGREDIEMSFSKKAKGLRGLVGWVEVPGVIRTGEAFEARLPPQRLYRV